MSRSALVALLLTAVLLTPGAASGASTGEPKSPGAMCGQISVEATTCTVPGRSLRTGPLGPCVGDFGVRVFALIVTDRTSVTVGTKDQDLQASEPTAVFGLSGCMERGAHPGDQAGAPTFVSRLGLMF